MNRLRYGVNDFLGCFYSVDVKDVFRCFPLKFGVSGCFFTVEVEEDDFPI